MKLSLIKLQRKAPQIKRGFLFIIHSFLKVYFNTGYLLSSPVKITNLVTILFLKSYHD